MAGKTSRNGKGYYATYKAANIFSKNKEKKLKRHLKEYPNDAQAQEALKSQKFQPRKTPKAKRWDASSKWMAQIESQMRGLWNAIANGQVEKPEPDPRYMNWGMEEPKAQAPAQPKSSKPKRNRRLKKKEAA